MRDVQGMHDNGVHVHCNRRDCRKAGTVERVHSHDFDGPLWDACECPEVGQ